MGIFSRNREGEVYNGVAVRCSDPLLVPWPGHYGTKPDGSVDAKCLVQWDVLNECWRRVK